MADLAAEKKTKGRRVLPMKQIENKTALVTTFCKRRMGLFKKANEICTLCAVQIALIIFSPAGKLYTFGHPDVDSVMKDYLARHGVEVKDLPLHLEHVKNCESAEILCEELAQVRNGAKTSQNSGGELAKIMNASKNENWWKKPIGDMNLSELEDCKKVMEELMAIAPEDKESSSIDEVGLDLVPF